MTTTHRTALGFAAVICAAIAVMPMLVETGQLSAQAAPLPQAASQVIHLAAVR